MRSDEPNDEGKKAKKAGKSSAQRSNTALKSVETAARPQVASAGKAEATAHRIDHCTAKASKPFNKALHSVGTPAKPQLDAKGTSESKPPITTPMSNAAAHDASSSLENAGRKKKRAAISLQDLPSEELERRQRQKYLQV